MILISSSIKQKRKLPELEVVRSIAILAVVLIHATSEGTVRLASGSTAQKWFVLFNSLPHFSVPSFLFISGLVLAYRYGDSWTASNSVRFFRKRLIRTAIPFVIWSGFYYVWSAWMTGRPLVLPGGSELLRLLLQGSASYHLYFLVLIIQYYVLFPFLMTWAKASVRFRQALLLLGICVEAVYYFLCRHYAPDAFASNIGLTYLAHFTAGCWIGLYYESFAAKRNMILAALLPLTVLSGAVYGWMTLHLLDRPHDWDPSIHVLVVHLYSLLAAVSLTALAGWLTDAFPSALRFPTALGASSFGIYLVHPAVLQLFAHVWRPPVDIPACTGYTVLAFLVCVSGSWLLEFLYVLLRKRLQKWLSQG